MAVPKSKSVRKIVIDEIPYYWAIKYDEDYGIIECNIGLYRKPNCRFSFIRGAASNHERYIHNGIDQKDEVRAITPDLVRKAILFANENLDWKNPKPSRIYSNDDGFSISYDKN